jgi:hypothetical protein
MKTISTIVLSLLVTVSYALASGENEVEGSGLMTAFFITFGVMIILSQLLPGLMLLGGMLKEMFTHTEKKVLDCKSELQNSVYKIY